MDGAECSLEYFLFSAKMYAAGPDPVANVPAEQSLQSAEAVAPASFHRNKLDHMESYGCLL